MKTIIDEIMQTNETSFDREKGGFHPTLGYGKSISFEQEFPFHPALGRGRQVSWEANNEMEEELVGTDDRIRVQDTKPVPFRWICHLDLDFPDPDNPGQALRFYGTGILISPRHILTAGHCLYDRIQGSGGTYSTVQVRRVIAYPGRNASFSLGSAQSIAFKIHSNWLSNRNYRFDIGLIKLDKNIGDQVFSSLGNKKLGFWGSPNDGYKSKIVPLEKSQFLNQIVNVAGYPGDKGETDAQGFKKADWLMSASDIVVNTNPQAGNELIYYKTDTCGGESGGPVWQYYSDGSRYLIAIHTGPCISGYSDCSTQPGKTCFPNSRQSTSNRGVFLSRSIIDLINQWVRTA